MAKTIMDEKREKMKKEFLSLIPLQRIRRMSAVFNDFIALKAKTKGVPEYEIYRSYVIQKESQRKRYSLENRDNDTEGESKDQQLY